MNMTPTTQPIANPLLQNTQGLIDAARAQSLGMVKDPTIQAALNQQNANTDELTRMQAKNADAVKNGTAPVLNLKTTGEQPTTTEAGKPTKQAANPFGFEYLKSVDEKRAEEIEAQRAWDLAHRDRGGGGGCFITSATVQAIDNEDSETILNEFRAFRDEWLAMQPQGQAIIASYYDIAPKIVTSIGQSRGIYALIWEMYLQPCREFIREKDPDAAFVHYKAMCQKLAGAFL